MSARELLASCVDALARLNVVMEEQVDGVRVFRKRRQPWAPFVILCGDLFLRGSDARIGMFASPRRFRAWEVHCARLLRGQDAAHERGGWLVTRAVDGESLRDRHARGALTVESVAAGARVLAAAHTRHCPAFDGPWSHGDPHLGNVIVDDHGPGGLIDFETRHRLTSPAADRHGDDLATFLFDLLGLDPADDDVALARVEAAVSAYAPSEDVRRALRARLVARSGLAGVLVSTRTHHLPVDALQRRLARVQATL